MLNFLCLGQIMTKVLEILVGIPGSGKSTYSKSQVPINPFHADVYRTNKDDLRLSFPNAKEKEIVRKEDELIRNAMNIGYRKIIVDNTHMNKKHWIRLEALAKEGGYEVQYKWFDDSLDPDLCHKRNILPGRTPVPWQVIETMYQQYFSLWMQREGVQISKEGKKAIIVDIDGTVAHNDGHRGWFDWDKVGGDTPHDDIISLVIALEKKGYHVIFMSGRDKSCWEQTSKWLWYQFGGFIHPEDWSLFMRPEGDMRKDSIVKFELFQEYVNGKYDIHYVLDDRWQVVRQWRAMGFRCLSVDNGFK